MRLLLSRNSQAVARPGFSFMSAPRAVSPSKMLLAADDQSTRKVSIGSQLPGSIATATVTVPAACAPDAASGVKAVATVKPKAFKAPENLISRLPLNGIQAAPR